MTPAAVNLVIRDSSEPFRQKNATRTESRSAKPLRQATPPSRSAKPLRQVTPPSHSAKSLRQVAPPSHSAKSLRQVAPPSRSPPGRGWPKAGRGAARSLAKTRQDCGRIRESDPEQERLSPKRACRARSTSPGRRPGFRPLDRPGPVGAVHRGRAESAGSRHSAPTTRFPRFISAADVQQVGKPVPPPRRPTSSVIPCQPHSAKSLRQVTPPSHSAKSLRQVAPPSRSAKSLRQVAPPSHSAKSLRQVTPPSQGERDEGLGIRLRLGLSRWLLLMRWGRSVRGC
jgi:hypothetical protein